MSNTPYEYWNAREATLFEQRTKESGRLEAITRMAELFKQYQTTTSGINLDLGCGTGLFAKILQNQNIVGVDFSANLLKLSSSRMADTIQADIFTYQRGEKSVDNIVSLFVIDDYPGNRKSSFFKSVFNILKPKGHFFFSSYSPQDERMGALKTAVNEKLGNIFKIYTESVEYYVRQLQVVGFEIIATEKLRTAGRYVSNNQSIHCQREFDLIVAAKS